MQSVHFRRRSSRTFVPLLREVLSHQFGYLRLTNSGMKIKKCSMSCAEELWKVLSQTAFGAGIDSEGSWAPPYQKAEIKANICSGHIRTCPLLFLPKALLKQILKYFFLAGEYGVRFQGTVIQHCTSKSEAVMTSTRQFQSFYIQTWKQPITFWSRSKPSSQLEGWFKIIIMKNRTWAIAMMQNKPVRPQFAHLLWFHRHKDSSSTLTWSTGTTTSEQEMLSCPKSKGKSAFIYCLGR